MSISLEGFIRKYRREIDEIIGVATQSPVDVDDDEREQWILNHEGLYRLAQREGVRI